ncbi:MAG: acetyl-CoA hydrolase/transferase C-terminal domain-containing protein, partial [Chloroflexota bacterium]|nr:acetyl-CoA hydrolase/transferase C-terminal domain-containing protein [Chloroflexota bacterium]
AIAEHIAGLIQDGDTIQIGTGTATGSLVVLGALDQKHDLGCHSELGLPDIGRLVKSGIVTGKRKTLHPGKVVCTTVEFGSWAREEDVAFAHNNPLFELYGADYVNDIRTIAANDNMVAINSALCVDLTGQTSAESQFGSRLWNGPGGQQEFAIGALLSRGGRSLTVLRSTALNGSVSRIVPQFDEGTKVTIPRTFGDYVVTEYGVARLMGKSHRERAQELIAIAHPDFRPELEKQARKQLYP